MSQYRPQYQQAYNYQQPAPGSASGSPTAQYAPPAQPLSIYIPQGHPQTQPVPMEMARFGPSQGPQAAQPAQRDPHYIINEARQVTDEARSLESRLSNLQQIQARCLHNPNDAAISQELDRVDADINATYRALIKRLKYLKTRPESGAPLNQSQIGLADRTLQEAFQKYRVLETEHRRRIREQLARQYKITRPDATPDEVQQAVADTDGSIFAQALMSSTRAGDSRQVLGAVRDRHVQIAKIEQQMVELGALFEDLARAVAEQEPVVQRVEAATYETYDNVEKGNANLDVANRHARSARKKKWICLGISIAIVIILIIILLIILKVTNVI